MDQLPDAVARRWSELRAAYEASCRSAARPGPGAGVDAILAEANLDLILEELADLVRTLARSELDAIRRQSGPGPAGRPAPPPNGAGADPGFTTDLPSGPHQYVIGSRGVSDPSAVTGAAPETDHRRADPTPHETATPGPAGGSGGFVLRVPSGGSDGHAQTTDGMTASSPGADATEKTPEPTRRKVPAVPGYDITGVLGRGGMGVVYKAVQVGLNRTVALKMILAGEHASATQLTRFAAEAKAVAAVRHPNIVQVYEIGEHDGLPYFSLEFCPGGSLDKKLNHEPQPPRAAATLLETLARAVHAAHTAGVIHRDIKPANVLLDADGTPKVTDFGLARAVDGEDGQTRTGAVLGTPSYMAPEQALGKTKEVGPAADQYSLGATLYDLLTGRPPFQGASAMETVELVRTREPVPPTQLRPEVPRDLETICLKALQKEPGKRYPSCQALADDLRAYLDGRPITARPVGRVEKAWRWARRNPKVAGLAAAVTMLLFAIGIGGVTFGAVYKRIAGERQEALDLALIREKEAIAERDQKEIARRGEAEQRQVADESYTLARESLLGVVDDVPRLLQDAVFARSTRQQVLGVLGTVLEKQLALAATRGLPDRALLNFHLKMGDLLAEQGKPDDARRHYQEALAITERLLKSEQQEKDKAKGNHALVLQKLGVLARDARRNGPEALELLAQAGKLQREVVERPETGEIPPAEAKQSLSGTLFEAADTHRRMLRFDDALPTCEEALRLRAEVVSLPATPYTRSARRLLADSHLQLGRIQARRGKDAEAEKALAEAVAIHRQLVEQTPENPAARYAAGRAARELGDFLLMRNRLADATPYHEWDVELTRGLLRTPEVLAVQSELSDVYYRSATLALKKGDRQVAAELYRKCLDLREQVAAARPGDDRARMRVANARARCGEHAAAATTMGELLAKYKADVNVVMEAACTFGLCADAVAAGRPAADLSDEEKALRDGYRDRALVAVERLVGEFKYTDVVKLKTDPDLDPIRSDPRFQATLRRLESKAPGKQ